MNRRERRERQHRRGRLSPRARAFEDLLAEFPEIRRPAVDRKLVQQVHEAASLLSWGDAGRYRRLVDDPTFWREVYVLDGRAKGA